MGKVMELTRYGFSEAVSAFFEMPTTDARKLLPAHLQPLELQHTRSILSITAFIFTESMVGEYNEIVLSVIVPPRVEPGLPLPKAAFYPFMVGTTTDESREHAIERWHLPHYMKAIDIDLSPKGDRMEVKVADAGRPRAAASRRDAAEVTQLGSRSCSIPRTLRITPSLQIAGLPETRTTP